MKLVEDKSSSRGYRWAAIICCVLLSAILSSCGKKEITSGDVLTMKAVPDGRKVITVLVKNAFSINGFESAVEEKFPDIDIVQVGNYTRDMGIEEYNSRLEHDDLTDIIMTWPLDVGSEYWSERLLDLSGMSFTSAYNLSMLDTISSGGKLYYVPGPAQVRGIVYNKTLFEENGWVVPSDFEGFLELCHSIEDTGIRSLQLGLNNSEVLDTAFVGYGYADCFSKPLDSKWLENYNKGEGSFGDHFEPALDTFQRLIDEGILKKADLDIDYSQREEMMFTRKCAMIEDSVLIARAGYSLTGSTDEFALMPFFNPGENSDWARLYMVCYVGMNKHLAEPENKETYELATKLMNYISTPEGQEALMSDTGAMFSSVKGTQLPDVAEIKDLVPALSHGRYAIFPELENAQSALREGLAGMVSGRMSKEAVIELVDEQNLDPPNAVEPEVLGAAAEDFTRTDTGNYIADMMKQVTGCDLALILDDGKDGQHNSRGVAARLYKGEVTTTDIERVMPDFKYAEQGSLCKVSMTGADLLNTLEYSIKIDKNLGGWFYYFSGLKMEFKPDAEPGSRIKKITTSDGKDIDESHIYTVAIMENSVSEEYIISSERTEILVPELLAETIRGTSADIRPLKDGRLKLVTQ